MAQFNILPVTKTLVVDLIEKIAKEQGISLEAATAVVASEAVAAAEAALAEPILPPNS